MYGRWTEKFGDAQSFSCYEDARKRANSLVFGDGRVVSVDDARKMIEEVDRESDHRDAMDCAFADDF